MEQKENHRVKVIRFALLMKQDFEEGTYLVSMDQTLQIRLMLLQRRRYQDRETHCREKIRAFIEESVEIIGSGSQFGPRKNSRILVRYLQKLLLNTKTQKELEFFKRRDRSRFVITSRAEWFRWSTT